PCRVGLLYAPRPRAPDIARRSFLSRACSLVLCAEVSLAWAADDEPFRYRGREYIPTGSSVARRLQWLSKLPFDKTYDELTAAQIAYMRDQYDGLTPDREAPLTPA